MKRAIYVRDVSEHFRGTAWLFKVEPAVALDDGSTTEYIIASAVDIPGCGPEVYLFPASPTGEVLSWAELEGSRKGTLDIAETLSLAGYQIDEIPRQDIGETVEKSQLSFGFGWWRHAH